MSYPDLPIVAGNRIECSCVLEARNNESKQVEAVVSCMDQSLFHIAMDAITELTPSVVPFVSTNDKTPIKGQIISLTASWSGDYIACFSSEGWLDVFDRNFQEKVTSQNTDSRVSPRGFAWCGDDSVVLYWRTLGLLLVNPFADWLKYTYDKQDMLILVTETDGLRVFSSLKQEVIRVVGNLAGVSFRCRRRLWAFFRTWREVAARSYDIHTSSLNIAREMFRCSAGKRGKRNNGWREFRSVWRQRWKKFPRFVKRSYFVPRNLESVFWTGFLPREMTRWWENSRMFRGRCVC